MPKAIISDVFETLGGVAAGVGQQAVINVKAGAEDLAKAAGVKVDDSTSPKSNELTPPAHTDEQYRKIENAAKARSAAKYKQIQEEIRQLEEKRKKELPKQITGKPGFSEEKAVKQLEVKKEEEKKLPPLPAQRASKKTEMFRGASG